MTEQKQALAKYGPWAVVTGASDGIGKAMAFDLAADGINVVLVARRRDVLQAVADEIEAGYGVNTLVVAADLALSDGVDAVIAAAQPLDVGLLVAAAGYGTAGRFIDLPLERELNMLDVNSRAVLALVHHFGRRFAEQRRGGIVLFSSVVAFQGVPRSANYAATKAYIQSLAEGLGRELAPMGVDVLASAPGPVASGFAARADMQMGAALTPDVVSRATLDALGRKTNVRPGMLSKVLIGGLNLLPRRRRVGAMAQIMAGMTQHQAQPEALPEVR